jgi:hypothetical protein
MALKLDLVAELPAEQVQEQRRQARRPSKLGMGLVVLAALATLVLRGRGPTVDELPGSLEFGSQPVQSLAPEQSVNIRNGGAADLHLKTALIAGHDAADFQVADADCVGRTTSVGQTCRVTLRFQPLAAGPREAKLILVDDAGNSPQSVNLTGKGIPRPDLSVTPSNVSFPEQVKGDVGDWQQVSLQNIGGGPLTVSDIELLDDTGTFALDAGMCSNAPLAAGEVCNVRVRFTPADAATYTARLIIRDSTGDAPHEIALSGNGRQQAAANGRITPSPVDFGTQPLEKTARQSVSLVSTGNIPLHTGDVTISGEGADEFVADDSCAHKEIAPGQQCQLRIRFTPRAKGKHEAQLLMKDDAGANLQTVALVGYGQPPATPPPPRNDGGTPPPPAITRVVAHPDRYNFDKQEALTFSKPRAVTVTSVGNAPARVQKFYTTGTSSAEFAVKDVNCSGRTLATNEECNLTVLFAPTASSAGSPQERSADLVIEVANTAALHIPLYGTTSAPAPTPPPQPGFLVSPVDVDFGDLQIGQQAKPRVVTLTNSGSAPLQVQAKLPQSSQGDFRLVQTNCVNGTIPARGSCVLALSFTPQHTGPAQTELTLASASPVQVESVRLRGRALPESSPPANFVLQPQELAFGASPVHTTSKPRIIALQNPGVAPIPIHASMLGGNSGDFGIVRSNCSNVSIPPGGCQLEVAFAPQDVGSRQAMFTVKSASQTQSVYLSGTGLSQTAPENLMVQPAEVEFGNVLVGLKGPVRQVALTNPGPAPVAFSVLEDSKDFAFVGSKCGNMVPAHGNCVLGFIFIPQQQGHRQSAAVVVWSSRKQPVMLSGNGVQKSVPPPVQTGWCCIRTYSMAAYNKGSGYSLQQITPNECAQRKGQFFTDYRTANASCKPPQPTIGWEQRLRERPGEALSP